MGSGPLLGPLQGEAGCQKHQKHVVQAAQGLATVLVQTRLHLKGAVQLPAPGPAAVLPEQTALVMIH